MPTLYGKALKIYYKLRVGLELEDKKLHTFDIGFRVFPFYQERRLKPSKSSSKSSSGSFESMERTLESLDHYRFDILFPSILYEDFSRVCINGTVKDDSRELLYKQLMEGRCISLEQYSQCHKSKELPKPLPFHEDHSPFLSLCHEFCEPLNQKCKLFPHL